jgi:penicillin-binding protein 2
MRSAPNNPADSIEGKQQMLLRLEMLRVLAIIVLVALGGRLYWLQIKNGDIYKERADSNRYRTLPVSARRGRIYDRNGKLLADSKYAYNIILERKLGNKEIRPEQFPQVIELLVNNLNIEREFLTDRLEDAKSKPRWQSIVVKEEASPSDVAWVESHKWEYPELRAEKAPQRYYPFGSLAAHAIGYVGEVSKAQLLAEGGKYSAEKGFDYGSIVGKAGLEDFYNEVLTGRDGYRRVQVNSNGIIQLTVDQAEPIPGRDIYVSLDLELQKIAEKQGDGMVAGRGAIGVMDPNNGEILSFVSRPTYDPNIFSQLSKTPVGKETIAEYWKDEDRPLYNRMIMGGFVPGSTWKLMTTVAALNEKVITPEDSRVQDGDITLGTYVMHSMSHEGMPDIVRAITVSADGYYYRLGLKMGEPMFAKWVEIFKFGHKTGIDLPRESDGLQPVATTKRMLAENLAKRLQKEIDDPATTPEAKKKAQIKLEATLKEGEWNAYDMAASSFGQGQNKSTPTQLMRYVGGLANGGHMYTPHFLIRTTAGTDRDDKFHPEIKWTDANYFTVPMAPEIHDIVKRGMYGAVNSGGGTGGGAHIAGFDVCGKTGTAQVASNKRAGVKNKDHAWFISFAPRDKPQICSVVLTENAGFGGKQSAPRARAIYDNFYRRGGLTPPQGEAQAALNQGH